jgi:hypothetical protein
LAHSLDAVCSNINRYKHREFSQRMCCCTTQNKQLCVNYVARWSRSVPQCLVGNNPMDSEPCLPITDISSLKQDLQEPRCTCLCNNG